MLLLILAAIWAAVLLPPWLQNRRERRPNDSIVSFRSQLATLQRATPGENGALRFAPAHLRLTRAEARRRRRDILAALGGSALLTLFLALFLGGTVLALHLFIDVLLVGYVAALVHTQQQQVQRSQTLRRMPSREPGAPEPALLLRRTGT